MREAHGVPKVLPRPLLKQNNRQQDRILYVQRHQFRRAIPRHADGASPPNPRYLAGQRP